MAGAMRRPEAMRAAGEAGLVAFGGMLLILPGLLTDVAGLALMVPWVRRLVMARIGARVAWWGRAVRRGDGCGGGNGNRGRTGRPAPAFGMDQAVSAC